MSIGSPFWAPERHADRRPRLIARARAAAAIRGYFGNEGYLEVDPAALQFSPGNETHLHGFSTSLSTGEAGDAPAFLHTSPEFAMKKLLAGGETHIFALAHVFRNRERTALHAPEFTMLEWYRKGEELAALEADCLAVLRACAEAAGATRFRFRGRECDPFAQAERLSVREAFLRHAGVDVFATRAEGPPSPALPHEGGGSPRGALRPTAAESPHRGLPSPPPLWGREREGGASATTPSVEGLCPVDDLEAACARLGLRTAADDTWSDLFSRLLSVVEPHLGLGRPTFLTDYPASEAALARLNPADPRVAERFELYACGVELANAFGELTDPHEQRRRFEADMALKQAIYGESYPIDEDFLACLPYIGEASGAALGFDRAVMLACGADSVEDVQWTPVFRP